ncbi:MAG: CPBP family glutamic-type intramembrane protease [Candidatus Rokuibacteriota bacterium]
MVWALEAAVAPPPQWRLGAPLVPALALAAEVGTAALLVAGGWMPPEALRVAGLVALHGALLSAALSRAARSGSPTWSPIGPALVSIGLVTVALAAAALDRRGAVAAPAVLLWLTLAARRGRLGSVGVRRPSPASGMLLGLGTGATLGAHMLFSAPLTLGYRLRDDGAGAYLAALAYDIGINVPSSELFFRGVLFDHMQRRASFAAAAMVATIGYVGRYLLDPLLPHAVETIAGAVVYLSLLSLACCWLFWRTGSVVPGAAGALTFFAAYRALAIG